MVRETESPPSYFHLFLHRAGESWATQDTHINGEVLGGAGDGAHGRKGLGDVLQGHSGRTDAAGQADDSKAQSATERPAVPRVNVRLHTKEQDTVCSSVSGVISGHLPL